MMICFLANYSKTYLFDKISEHLVKVGGVKVCWIVVNQKLYDHLLTRYPAENVLYLGLHFIDKPAQPQGDYCINELIFGDRALRHHMNDAVNYLTNIQKPVADFIRQRKISAFFGEHTWAHELLVERMAASYGIPYLDPQVVRIPNGRFAFFYGESHEDIFKMVEDRPLNGVEIFTVQKPTYLKINNKILEEQRSVKGRLGKAKRFFTNENIDRNDPTIISKQSLRFRIRTKMEINKEAYYLLKRVSFEDIRDTDYVFHTLHMQPESTIDVFGRYYEDQYQMILNLWRKLPQGWKLVIKEHTNAIGDRPYSFYRKIAKLPNVCFVHEKTNSHELIMAAKLVATVAGTVAYEAALLGVPAVIFSKAYFCRLSGCSYKTLKELAECKTIESWVIEAKNRIDNRKEFCQYILDNSFEGIMTDPISDPAVMSDENIEKLGNAFAAVLRKLNQNATIPKVLQD